jgi:GNAT superfamily N-acetyltransferase
METMERPYPLADLELARRLERTEGLTSARFVGTKARVQPASGAACLEVDGTYAMFDGPASPLTQTFGLGMAKPVATKDLERLERFFTSRGAPVDHEVSPLAGVDLLATLANRGYRPIECSSVMYRPIHRGIKLGQPANERDLAMESRQPWLAAPPTATPEGLKLGQPANERIRVRRVESAEHSTWVATAAEGWREAGDFTALMQDVVDVFARSEGWTPFLAELDGKPIAAGALSIIEGVALLAGASTIPSARKQGAQLALLETRLRFAAEQGCDLAMMGANPGSGSQRNAERHGFRIAYTRIKWRLGQAS